MGLIKIPMSKKGEETLFMSISFGSWNMRRLDILPAHLVELGGPIKQLNAIATQYVRQL